MNCDEIRGQLPDYVLSTLSETEMAGVRRHLRGCSACRVEATTLDEGLSLFASAAHEAEPPVDLRSRVMEVLAQEWAETPATRRSSGSWIRRWPALAAGIVLLAGALTWGSIAQTSASRYRDDALSYREFLHALGGLDVRVASLQPLGGAVIDGSAVLYDSDKGQSWVLVMARAPGYEGETLGVTLVSKDGRAIPLHPMQISADGQGSTWLVSSADIAPFDTVKLVGPAGQVLASGVVRAG